MGQDPDYREDMLHPLKTKFVESVDSVGGGMLMCIVMQYCNAIGYQTPAFCPITSFSSTVNITLQ